MTRRGHTLVEIVVAVVLLEVGILAVSGTLLLASRTLAQASLLEWAAAEVQLRADALTAGGATGGGQLPSGPGSVTWQVDPGGRFVVEYRHSDTVLAVVEGAAPHPEAAGG